MVAASELVQRKARNRTVRPGHPGFDVQSDAWRTGLILEKEMILKKINLALASSIKLKRSAISLADVSRGRLRTAPPTFLILMSWHVQGQYALRKESAYMSCTYTKISLTQQDIWFLFWRSWVWLKGWLTSVCALVGQTDSSASMFCVDVDFYIRVIVLNWTVCSF